MNKKLIVVAIGAALTGSAFAQSSNVTLYGRINTAIESNSVGGDSNQLNGTETSMRSYSSRLGVRGVEDLGGGLKGVFGIETGLNSDNGTGGLGGNLRNSYIGLDTGSTGRLVLGRLDAAINAPLYTQFFGVIDPIGYDAGAGQLANADDARQLGATTVTVGTATVPALNVGAPAAAIGANTIAIVQRKSNAVGYDVKVGDVNVSARYSMDGANNTTAVGGTQTNGENSARTLEVAANYKVGALTLGAGYETASFRNNLEAAGQFAFDNRFQVVGGYDLGFAKVGASLARNSIETTGAVGSATNPAGADKSGNEVALSVTAPLTTLSPKASVVANYASRDLIGLNSGNVNFNGKRTQWAYGARYDFTKRTQAYALYNYTDASDKTINNESRSVIVGVRHNF